MIHQAPVAARKSIITFLSTVVVSLYWFLSQLINVYQIPLVGAIYELLWTGMLLALFGLPVFSFIQWAKTKFDLRSFYFYSFLLSAASALILSIFFR
jgi:hypothetical protein